MSQNRDLRDLRDLPVELIFNVFNSLSTDDIKTLYDIDEYKSLVMGYIDYFEFFDGNNEFKYPKTLESLVKYKDELSVMEEILYDKNIQYLYREIILNSVNELKNKPYYNDVKKLINDLIKDNNYDKNYYCYNPSSRLLADGNRNVNIFINDINKESIADNTIERSNGIKYLCYDYIKEKYNYNLFELISYIIDDEPYEYHVINKFYTSDKICSIINNY